MNKETEFTKGEWIADIRVGCCAVYPKDSRDEWEQGLHNDDDNIYYKGYTNITTNPELAFRSKEKIANAHLIASAPKLYDALDGLISSEDSNLTVSEIMIINELLAEARGEQ